MNGNFHNPNYPVARLRNEILRMAAEAHPELPCSVFACIFKITRQRVLKIIGKRPLVNSNGKN